MKHGFDITTFVAISGLFHAGIGMLANASHSVAMQTSDVPREPSSAYSAPVSVAQESPGGALREEQEYLLRERTGPSVTLRVVDETGRATEVPVDFADARIEPRGFWGDVGVNGMALFFASVCIILVKEFFTWGTSKRQKAKAAAQRSTIARRRAAISEQLEAAEAELREIRLLSREGKDEDAVDSAKRLVGLLDSYRDEIKEYDAPALLAYADSLIAQVTQILRTRSTMREPKEAPNDVYHEDAYITEVPAMGRRGQQASRPSMVPPPKAPQAETVSSMAGPLNPDVQPPSSQPADDRDEAAAEDKVLSRAKHKQAFAPEAQAQPVQQESRQQVHPDMDLVQRIMMENPGMPPSKVINIATEITMRRRQRQLRSSP